MSDEKIVMFESDEAATYRTDIKGWVDRTGRYFGNDERTARYSGSTHATCDCGKVYEKARVRCNSCQAKKDTEAYYALPMVEWDEVTAVCAWRDDRFFFDVDSLLDFMLDCKETAKEEGYEPEVQIVLCEPHGLHLLDGSEWEDDLPEEGDLSAEVGAAIDALNAVLAAEGTVSWWGGKTRINLEPLWKRLETEMQECPGCSEAGGADRPVMHLPPMCKGKP